MYHKIRSLNRSVILGQIAKLFVAQYPVFDKIQKQTLNEDCKKQGMYNVVDLVWCFLFCFVVVFFFFLSLLFI